MYKNGNLQKQMDYVGNFIYENDSLSFIITDNGRMLPKVGGGFDYEYYIKDHLGNTRVVVKDSLGIPAVQQENHYDPFGYALGGQTYTNPLQQTANKYLYNGKELQDDLGLDWYDYGARFYDAQIGRFHSPDPITDFFPGISPYNYAINNPILNIDFEGLGPKEWIRWIKKTFYELFHRETECISRYSRIKTPNFRTAKGGGGGNKPSSNNNETHSPSNIVIIGNLGFQGFDNTVEKPVIDRIVNVPNTPPQDNNVRIKRDVGGNNNNSSVNNSPYTVEDVDFMKKLIITIQQNPNKYLIINAKKVKDEIYKVTDSHIAIRISPNRTPEEIIIVLNSLGILSANNIKLSYSPTTK